MVRMYLLLVTSLLFFQYAQAQNKTTEGLRSAFNDGEYFLAKEYFADALAEYNSIYKRGFEENAHLNYRIGICYLNIFGEKEKALHFLEKAVSNVDVNYKGGSLKEENAPIDAYLYLGDAYRCNSMLDKAIATYREFLSQYPSADPANIAYANSQISACERAREAMDNPLLLVEQNLGAVVNSSSSNYGAVMSGDGSTLVFMNGLAFYDAIYMCTLQEDNTWSDPENITSQIESDGNQFVASLSYNADELYLVKEGAYDSDIMVSIRKENGEWGRSMALSKLINTKHWESHACVSRDGQTLYFSSNKKGGYGEMDIYISKWNPEGYWDEPVNAGENVNTEFDDNFPFITMDDERLYFSSQGHENIGGTDIFYSERNESGEFDKPKNVGYPINTPDNDNFFFPIGSGNSGLKTMVTDDGFGEEDIYKITIKTGGLESKKTN